MTAARMTAMLGATAALAALAAPAHAAPAASAAPPTVEEQRLDQAVPQEILRRSGFAGVAPSFTRALERAGSHRAAENVVARHGERLWRRAVDRAQGRVPAGDLDRADDRPLYWARLGMTRAIRRWNPSFVLSDKARARLLVRLERASRGQEDVAYPHRVRRILVTGFDPFTLDRDIRIGNPSGATALALDGTVVRTSRGPARIETMTFPVRWRDFTDGMVERALRPHLPRVDLFTTVSQGRPDRFDVERFNGAWRGGFPDNERASSTGLIPVRGAQPQWTVTTLPHRAMVGAGTGPFQVIDNTQVTEIPAGGTTEVVRPDGPTPGSAARAGAGGNYLSNEIAYRATLLRDRLGLTRLPGGHLHTPVLRFGDGNTDPGTGTVTDPQFERNRRAIVTQARDLITAAASATARSAR
ncbi:hypothetical protein GCM10009678_71670 [Actinomadura kijaniata]|uniref:Pyrrolidone-carboxylate peptidase n=1 Tax=Actinomadura namibiensis TaxID=182080 RepID=A0A7W3LRY5_ACTNM|nr:pyroglutamyl peptidase [Actinomadura namibiensis]MBA8953236.1 pyrrolidone-carboxylate peptidase [Actinomadura namibiensis]